MNPDQIYWEAYLSDGTIQREVQHSAYRDIDRRLLTAFSLVYHGEVLLQTFVPGNATGQNLVYRRRTSLSSNGGWRVILVVGWVPMGPVHVLDTATGNVMSRSSFDDSDPNFSTPVQMSQENEDFDMTDRLHQTDARLQYSSWTQIYNQR